MSLNKTLLALALGLALTATSAPSSNAQVTARPVNNPSNPFEQTIINVAGSKTIRLIDKQTGVVCFADARINGERKYACAYSPAVSRNINY